VIGVAARRPLAMYMRTIVHRCATDRLIPDRGVDVSGAFETVTSLHIPGH
jgi:hypothetical protein